MRLKPNFKYPNAAPFPVTRLSSSHLFGSSPFSAPLVNAMARLFFVVSLNVCCKKIINELFVYSFKNQVAALVLTLVCVNAQNVEVGITFNMTKPLTFKPQSDTASKRKLNTFLFPNKQMKLKFHFNFFRTI